MKNLFWLSLCLVCFACNNTQNPTPSPIDSVAKSTTDTSIVDKAAMKWALKYIKPGHQVEVLKKLGIGKFAAGTANNVHMKFIPNAELNASGMTIDTIFVAATTSGHLLITNLTGNPNKPTVIINEPGQYVNPNDPSGDAAIEFGTCRYWHLTSTPAAGHTYGIFAGKGGTGSFDAHYGSSDGEIDHIEMAGSSYAGLIFRTYPSEGCQWSVTGGNGPANTAQMNAPKWAIYNMNIHDNYIHDEPGEGMYLGCSHYGNADANAFNPVSGNPLGGCSSGNEAPIIGMKVFNNLVKNVGYDGIQVSGCVSGCSVTQNSIIGFATGNTDGQDGGITWNPGSVGTVDRNWIQYTGNGVCMGIMYQGQGDSYFTNNVIIGGGSGQVGIAFLRNTQPNVTGSTHSTIYFAGNTVTGFQTGYWWYGQNGFTTTNLLNTIINSPTPFSIGNGNISNLTKPTTYEGQNPVFVSIPNNNYRLASGSPCISKGQPLTYDVTDYTGSTRNNPPNQGAYDSAGGTPPPPVTITVTIVPAVQVDTLPKNTASFTGNAVRNPSGAISTYQWTSNCTACVITTPNAANTTVTAIPQGTWSFALQAKDAQGNSGSQTASVTVNPAGGGTTYTVNITPKSTAFTSTSTIPSGATTLSINVAACPACPPPTNNRTALPAYFAVGTNKLYCKYTTGTDSTYLGTITTVTTIK